MPKIRNFKVSGNIITTAGLLVCAIIFASCSQAKTQHTASHQDIKSLVAREAINLGIPVPLALAVAHTESNFNPRAQSHKGARGVMQIMPATALGEYGIEPDLLWDARINIRIGLHFLGRLLVRYRGRVDLALSYYNGGSRVGTLPHARVIPATRSYVSKVKKLRIFYRRHLHTLTLVNLKGDRHVFLA
ncbi:MAG: lytic transglycosylase domain-containing protein [Sneathiella sp.]|nr:lytic transglycosylase domain-containing protein [Sneathiella sp.]